MTSDHVQQRIVLLLADVHDAARAGDWLTVRDRSEQVLHLNPFNHDARAYWALAKNGGTPFEEPLEARIGKQLDAVKIAVAVADWPEVIEESEKVLALDPNNAEARGYVRAAHDALAPKTGKRSRNEQTAAPALVSPLPREASEAPPAIYVFADSNFLSKALSGFIAALSVLYLLAAGFYYYGAGIVEKVDRGEAPAADAASFDDMATLVASLLLVGFAAGLVLFLLWIYREVTNARAMGIKTLASPVLSVAIGLVAGAIGSYIVLRDLLYRLRGSFSLAGEALLAGWLIGAIGGVALNFSSRKHPADNGEWADLLMLVCYGSFLLGVAGLCLAYSIREGHQHLLDRYLRPNRPPRADTTTSIAA